MRDLGRLSWLCVGLILGITGATFAYRVTPTQVLAANDRHEDYVLCTGPVLVNPRVPSDGIWLLDYRTGRLMGTVIDHLAGTIAGWAEVDLVKEFDIPPRSNVHFLMTCGVINNGQSALYVAETQTGKFAVYTMGIRPDNQSGMSIMRHSIASFRANSQQTPANPNIVIPTGGIQNRGMNLPGVFPGTQPGTALPGNNMTRPGFVPGLGGVAPGTIQRPTILPQPGLPGGTELPLGSTETGTPAPGAGPLPGVGPLPGPLPGPDAPIK